MEFDLLIRGGTVIDGKGTTRFDADVGINGDEIAAVGDLSAATAEEVISADGRVVAPGFIDIHTHSDTTLFEYPEADSRVRQGITTEVVGNCSFSPFPVNDDVRSFMTPCLTQGLTDLEWQWNDLAGYRECLQQSGTAVNVVPLVGHGSVRIAAMGVEQRAPTAAELRTMKSLAAESIEQGAFGFSTGLTLAPSSYSQTDELIEISKAVADKGGFYATHSRLWANHHYKAVEEAIEIGRQAELPIQISHQTIIDPRYFGKADHIVDMMQTARAEGIDVMYDVYPYTAGGTPLSQMLPDWAIAGGHQALLGRLADSATRGRIREDAQPGWFRGIPWQWERIQLAHIGYVDYQGYLGQSLAEVAEDLHQEPLDCMLHLIEVTGNDVVVVVFNRDEQDVQYFMSHPLSMIGSDGRSISPRGASLELKPHPRLYGTYPRILGKYCRELNVMSLEDAVRKMTSVPADRLGLRDRGTIESGKKADLVLFDPATVIDRATFADPHQFPIGIEHVLVNGQPVVSANAHTGKLPGRVLTK